MLTLDNNIYSSKKVFVTGHTGFKGSWFVYILKMLGAEIKGYSLAPNSTQKLFDTLDINSSCNSIFNDIRNGEKLKEEILDFQPDFIFHLAAQSLVLEGYKNPSYTYETNVFGTMNVLEAVKELEKKCEVIIITTDKVYQNKEEQINFKETDAIGGKDPYSGSKACADHLTQTYRESYFNPESYIKHEKSIAVARCGNVIGGGDWASDRLIPDFLRAIKDNKAIELRNPEAVRPWTHVLDCLYGYLLLGQKMYHSPIQFSDNFNFGSDANNSITVEDICKKLIQEMGKGSYNVNQEKNQLHESQLLRLEVSKSKNEMGWSPKIKTVEAVKLTVDWHKEYDNNKSVEVTKKQVGNYFNQA